MESNQNVEIKNLPSIRVIFVGLLTMAIVVGSVMMSIAVLYLDSKFAELAQTMEFETYRIEAEAQSSHSSFRNAINFLASRADLSPDDKEYLQEVLAETDKRDGDVRSLLMPDPKEKEQVASLSIR